MLNLLIVSSSEDGQQLIYFVVLHENHFCRAIEELRYLVVVIDDFDEYGGIIG